MTKFFIPYATTAEMAEGAYLRFVKASGTERLAHPTARLYQITFRHVRGVRVHFCVAEVGKDITPWPEPSGPVLAIVETTHLMFIHTVKRGGLTGGPIMVASEEVAQSVYFEDYKPS